MYRELEARQEQAVQRAARLLAEYGDAHNPPQDNSCTMVHFLVQALNQNVRL